MHGVRLGGVDTVTMVFPQTSTRFISPDVPSPYRDDYSEANAVLSLSPKASAALSRRVLQAVLHDVYQIKDKDLYKEVATFIARSDVPSELKTIIDAVRNLGNLAAHPMVDTHAGTIVDVHEHEAEWMLDILDGLFDFAFTGPAENKRRLDNFNSKLASVGKSVNKPRT